MRTRTLPRMAGLMLLGCGVATQDVSYDYDQRANFSAYRTYAWAGGANMADDLNHARIVAAVDRHLAAKGLAQVDSTQHPDVLVIYQVALTEDLEINAYDHRWAGPHAGPSRARVERVPVGTLAVAMIDARARSTVWRAAASQELDLDAPPEKWEKNINKAVEKLFKRYPGA